MASTIQLKTGTGSAVPSSLTQGEVAINIDNGLVYYGSGSGNAVKKLDSFTHITASGTISAAKLVVTEITSSRITSSVVVTSGSNIFGDTIADTHTFNGHITGSNISASGTIFTNTLSSPGNSLSIPSDTVTITAGTAGDANLILQADTDNNDEADNPFMLFEQDGGAIRSIIGHSGNDNQYPDATTFTGGKNNHLIIAASGSGASRGIQFGTGNTARITISSSGEVGIGTTTPGEKLEVVGNISSSGNVAGLSGSFSHIVLENNSRIVAKNNPSQTFIELQNDDGFKLEANNTPVFSAFSNGMVFNEAGTAQADFRIESDSDTHIFFVDSGNNKIAIGTGTVGNSLLTVDGDLTTNSHITASGNIRGTMPQIISANMGSVNLSTENFIPLAEGELEGTNGEHPRVNLVAPFSGSLRRVVMRSNAAFGTAEFTASLHTIRPGGTLTSDKDTVGQCFVDTAAANNSYAVVFDFANSVVGSNVIDGGDRVLIGVESTRTNSQNYYFTSVFTWDYQETTGLQTTSTSTSGGSI